VVLVALALRLPRLNQRPMHGDEAVNAVKFGQLLEEGSYRYDPHEFHGPTLNYLNLVPAWLGSAQKLPQISEFTLRIVPVFFGVLLVLMPLLLVRGLGKSVVILAAAFTAVSPAMVFYSRYYIHEMLLVCFTFSAIASGYRYTQNKNVAWAILTGLFLGLMYATKETCVIAFASMLLAALLVLMVQRRTPRSGTCVVKFRHIAAGAGTAVAVAVLFYSSFFTNPGGILDSVKSYAICINRAVSSDLHIHPWHYYLKMLMYSKYPTGPVFTEVVIIILAVIGFVVAMTRRALQIPNVHLLRFIALYTLTMTAIYSAIPYKTPWCMLTLLSGMILLAAVGALALIQLCSNLAGRTILSLILIAGATHLAAQAYLSSYTFSSDPVNPYVYAHPTTDVLRIAERVEQIARVHPAGHDMHIEVICPNDDYWPLPWYLRSFTSVGWYGKVDDSAPVAGLIIASPVVEADLYHKLYETGPQGAETFYARLFDTYLQLRPGVEITGFVTKDLWDKFQVTNDDSTAPR
jgi:uncharacterized protein (TIGR03663 family)